MSVHVRLRVSSEAYAIAVADVREVVELGQVQAVPRARRELLGVANLRGQILPVIDLAPVFGVARTAPPGRLLVVAAGERRAGFAIDEVSGVSELGDPTEETESALLTGATLDGGDLIGVISVSRVLDSLERG
jgi:chemotaxis signal transduction protein